MSEPVWQRPRWGELARARTALKPLFLRLESLLAGERERTSLLLAAPRSVAARHALGAALSAGDGVGAAAAAAQLAGCGEGRTPAGDDYLIGALYALRCLRCEPEAAELGAAVASAALARTTTLSASWIERAAQGEAIPEWHGFLHALAAGDGVELEAATRGLLILGHTSGHAALTGFVETAAALIGAATADSPPLATAAR